MAEPEDSLTERIAKARERHGLVEKDEEKQSGSQNSSASMAMRYSAEFVSAIIVSLLIGLGIDYIFNTKPWGLLILLALGLAAGVLGVIRAYKELTAEFSESADQPGSTSASQENKG